MAVHFRFILASVLLAQLPQYVWPDSGAHLEEMDELEHKGQGDTHTAATPGDEATNPPSPAKKQVQPNRNRRKETDVSYVYYSYVRLANCMGEFIGTALFVLAGCGSAIGIANQPGYAWVLQVALTWGLSYAALSYGMGHHGNGGQFNLAINFGMTVYGAQSIAQFFGNAVAQVLGAVTGASILLVMYPKHKDMTGVLGSNVIIDGWSIRNALLAEMIMTAFVMFTMLQVEFNPRNVQSRSLGGLAVGFSYFVAHALLIPMTGCSLNPARSLGPAIMAKLHYVKADTLSELWVFFLGPCCGAAIGAGVFSLIHDKLNVSPWDPIYQDWLQSP